MNRRGFTLIEVVIVLGLAGLVLLLVFYGVNQGNRFRRDNDRQTAAGKVLTAAKAWVASNNGTLPGAADIPTILTSAQGGEAFTDPSGNAWQLSWHSGTPALGATIYIQSQASCSAGSIVLNSTLGAGFTNTRQVAVAVMLEDGQSYCVST